MRALHREVLHAAAGLYPVPRLLDLVTPGLASKSARTRIECAEFLAERLDLDGAGPALASRSKPISAVAAVGAWWGGCRACLILLYLWSCRWKVGGICCLKPCKLPPPWIPRASLHRRSC